MEAQNSLAKVCAVLGQYWQGAVLGHFPQAGGHTAPCVTLCQDQSAQPLTGMCNITPVKPTPIMVKIRRASERTTAKITF